MRRRLPAAVGLLAVLVAALVPMVEPAGAATSQVERLRQQRRAVQQRRAAQASRINVLQADEQELGRALDALEVNTHHTRLEVESARQKAEAEQARAAAAKASAAATAAKLESLRTSVRQLAVDEFMRGGRPERSIDTDPTTPMESARRKMLLATAVGSSADAADRLRSAQEDLDLEQKAAEEAAAEAEAQQRKVEERLAQLEAATAQQEQLADKIEDELDRALGEADSLAAIDGTLATQIQQQQAAIARRLRSTTRTGRTSVGRVTRIGSISLSTVRGITVAASIGGNLGRMLDAADTAGISLSGGGFRDSSQQIATRRNNCGSSDYAIYQMPASQCSPPTARPGRSMHEKGLAIDFTSGGRILNRSSPAYRWLKANASRYGFYNLPSEPWHWSVNGD